MTRALLIYQLCIYLANATLSSIFVKEGERGVSLGEYLKTVSASSKLECVHKCKRFKECDSIKYLTDIKNAECQLLKHSTNGNVKVDFKEDSHQISDKKIHSSCKSIKKHYNDAPSGYYAITVGNFTTTVYCDMSTDHGGWMMIGNITTGDLLSYQFQMISTFNELSTIPNKNTLVGGRMLATMLGLMNFTEVRAMCYKPYHGRRSHIVLKGDHMLKFMTGRTSDPIPYCIEQIRFLPDDTSWLRGKDCSTITSLGHVDVDKRLYEGMFTTSDTVTNSVNHLECDDRFYNGNGFSKTGSWEFYVR